jgi:hypothetical protein
MVSRVTHFGSGSEKTEDRTIRSRVGVGEGEISPSFFLSLPLSSLVTMTSSSSSNPVVLVAGGSGYIGTHTLVILLEKGYNVCVVDNLINSSSKSLDAVCAIVGLGEEERKERLVFHKVDVCDEAAMRNIFETSPQFTSCIHFAGLKVSRNKENILGFLFFIFYTIVAREETCSSIHHIAIP